MFPLASGYGDQEQGKESALNFGNDYVPTAFLGEPVMPRLGPANPFAL